MTPRPAATVAILRDGDDGPEVLLTQRPATMAFGPRLHVFPGGALDAQDAEPALLGRLRRPLAGDPAGLHGDAFVVAAIREAWEEAGILLATSPGRTAPQAAWAASGPSLLDVVLADGLELRGDWLFPLSRWVTPPVVPRRFDARFFAAWLPDGMEPVFHPDEVAGHDWLTPRAALEAMADGALELWMPTSTTLQQLVAVRGPGDLATLVPPGLPAGPLMAPVPGTGGIVTHMTFGSAGGIPGVEGHAWLVGRDRVLVVDPGDPGDEAGDAIVGAVTARGARIAGVLVTAPFPSRAAGAEGLALRVGVPLLAAAGARRVLPAGITTVAPGDRPELADVEIRIVEPVDRTAGPGFGPEAGLALEVPAAAVVIAGGADVVRR